MKADIGHIACNRIMHEINARSSYDYKEAFKQFTVYKCDVASSFLYAHFDNPDLFMDGLSDYLLSESNLLNYANTLTPIEFTPTPAIYKKLYNT